MVIDQNPFMVPQEDDDILIAILSNKYGEDPPLYGVKNCSLQTIIPMLDAHYYPTTTSYLHTLLPHEIKTLKFYDLSMLDKVSKVSVSPRKELNISKSIDLENLESVI